MSIRLMSIVWDIPWLTQSQLLIALKLADYANDDGTSVYPSKNKIAAQARTSDSTVKRTLRTFRDLGILIVVSEGGNGPKDTTEYRFDVPLLMKLHDGYLRLAEVDGKLVVESGACVDNPDEKGVTVTPLISTRGSPDAEGGQCVTPLRGSMGDPQPITVPTIKEPSARERARREDFKSDLQGSGSVPSHEITNRDCQWQHWVLFLRDKGLADLAAKAEAAGRMMVTGSKWPKPDSPLPRIESAGLSATSKRMTGDAA